jgi:hypothetical protein
MSSTFDKIFKNIFLENPEKNVDTEETMCYNSITISILEVAYAN